MVISSEFRWNLGQKKVFRGMVGENKSPTHFIFQVSFSAALSSPPQQNANYSCFVASRM